MDANIDPSIAPNPRDEFWIPCPIDSPHIQDPMQNRSWDVRSDLLVPSDVEQEENEHLWDWGPVEMEKSSSCED